MRQPRGAKGQAGEGAVLGEGASRRRVQELVVTEHDGAGSGLEILTQLTEPWVSENKWLQGWRSQRVRTETHGGQKSGRLQETNNLAGYSQTSGEKKGNELRAGC